MTVPAGASSATFKIATLSQSSTTTVTIGGVYGGEARAALFGVTGSRGGSVLPAPRTGVFIEPFTFNPTPLGQKDERPDHLGGNARELHPLRRLRPAAPGPDTTVFAQPYVRQIGPPAPIVISQANIPNGTVGQPYGGFFFGGGGAPYAWPISAGALPPGVEINSSTSEITGAPTTRGTFSFTARITDSTGTFLDSPETITIS